MLICYYQCFFSCSSARATCTGLWKAVQVKLCVQVLDAVMRYSDRTAGGEGEQVGQQVEVLHWAAAIDDTGQPGSINIVSLCKLLHASPCISVQTAQVCSTHVILPC